MVKSSMIVRKKLAFPSRRGFALVLSLFLVLVLYTGMTIMVANLHTDMRASEQAFQNVQARFASQGAVNKLLVLLENGASLQRYSADSPLEIDIGRNEKVKAWVVEDENAGVYHIFSSFNGASYSKVITKKQELGARTYLNDGGVLYSAGADDTVWTPVPEPPMKVYNSLGELIDVADLTCYSSPRANGEGQVVSLFSHVGATNEESGCALYMWDEGSRTWSDVTPPNLHSQAPRTQLWSLNVEIFPATLGKEALYGWSHDGSNGLDLVSSFSRYDLKTKTWSEEIEGPSGGAVIRDGFVGPDDSFIAEVSEAGERRMMKWVEGVWSEIPALPNTDLVKVNANGPDGELFVTGADDVLYQLDQGNWTAVDAPLAAENLLSVDASGALLFAGEQPTEVFRWEDSSDPAKLPEVVDNRGIAGGGDDGEAADSGYQTTATF